MVDSNVDKPSKSGCPLAKGLERHIWPAGDGEGIVTRQSSDHIFGADGLGLGRTFWTTILSFLARNGIQEQTGSNKDETDIAACVKGWGQGAYSSRVFTPERGVDEARLALLLSHLDGLAAELRVPDRRITADVLGLFIQTQDGEAYLTREGVRRVSGWREHATGRFRGHVQWQGLVWLAGQFDQNSVKHLTPELIREFFLGEEPFFDRIVERRQQLKRGSLTPGERSGLLAHAPSHIDLVATDREYRKNKSGLLLLLGIARYMLFTRPAKLGPMPDVAVNRVTDKSPAPESVVS